MSSGSQKDSKYPELSRKTGIERGTLQKVIHGQAQQMETVYFLYRMGMATQQQLEQTERQAAQKIATARRLVILKRVYNTQKAERPQAVENSADRGIINIKASVLPDRFKRYLPDKERRIQIIEEGKALEKPIFDNGLLGKLATKLKPLKGYYDVVLHGSEYGLEYFGERIDVETLCAIIAQRKDYKKGTKIRLVSCNTGAEANGVAQYIADKLGVEVFAPDKKAIVLKKASGETVVYSGSKIGKQDGEFITFVPDKREKSE